MNRLFFYIYKFLEGKGCKCPFLFSVLYLTSLFVGPWVLVAGIYKEWKGVSVAQTEMILWLGVLCGFGCLYYVFRKNEVYLTKYKYKRRKLLMGWKKALMLSSPIPSLGIGAYFFWLIHNNVFLDFFLYCFKLSTIYFLLF